MTRNRCQSRSGRHRDLANAGQPGICLSHRAYPGDVIIQSPCISLDGYWRKGAFSFTNTAHFLSHTARFVSHISQILSYISHFLLYISHFWGSINDLTLYFTHLFPRQRLLTFYQGTLASFHRDLDLCHTLRHHVV